MFKNATNFLLWAGAKLISCGKKCQYLARGEKYEIYYFDCGKCALER